MKNVSSSGAGNNSGYHACQLIGQLHQWGWWCHSFIFSHCTCCFYETGCPSFACVVAYYAPSADFLLCSRNNYVARLGCHPTRNVNMGHNNPFSKSIRVFIFLMRVEYVASVTVGPLYIYLFCFYALFFTKRTLKHHVNSDVGINFMVWNNRPQPFCRPLTLCCPDLLEDRAEALCRCAKIKVALLKNTAFAAHVNLRSSCSEDIYTNIYCTWFITADCNGEKHRNKSCIIKWHSASTSTLNSCNNLLFFITPHFFFLAAASA